MFKIADKMFKIANKMATLRNAFIAIKAGRSKISAIGAEIVLVFIVLVIASLPSSIFALLWHLVEPALVWEKLALVIIGLIFLATPQIALLIIGAWAIWLIVE